MRIVLAPSVAPATTPSSPDKSVISWGHALWILIIVALLILGIGVVVSAARGWPKNRRPGDSVIRSWIAVVLVSALVVLAVLSLTLTDTDTRSVLIGGIAASAGSAVAFYFSSQSADKAREDILAATFGRETVPSLVDKTLRDATKDIAASALTLTVRRPDKPADDMLVDSQDPQAGIQVPKGSAVTVDLKPAPAPEPAPAPAPEPAPEP